NFAVEEIPPHLRVGPQPLEIIEISQSEGAEMQTGSFNHNIRYHSSSRGKFMGSMLDVTNQILKLSLRKDNSRADQISAGQAHDSPHRFRYNPALWTPKTMRPPHPTTSAPARSADNRRRSSCRSASIAGHAYCHPWCRLIRRGPKSVSFALLFHAAR